MDKKMIAKELISTAKRLMAANVYVQNTEILKQTSKYAEKFKNKLPRQDWFFVVQNFLSKEINAFRI